MKEKNIGNKNMIYAKKSKKNLLKVFAAVSASLSLSTFITACSSTNTAEMNNSTAPVFPDFNLNKRGTIPATIATFASSSSPNFSFVSSNEYGLNQNYQDFSDNYDLKTYKGDASMMQKDLLYFGYLLWIQNSRKFSISDISVNNYSLSNLEGSNVIFGTSKISFDLTLSIEGIQVTSIVIFDKTYSIEANQTYTLKISVKDQTINCCVNSLSDEFAIGWKVDTANISWNNISYVGSFTPTYNNFSYAFPYKIKGLTTKQNYLQLYSQYESTALNISDTDLQNQLADKFNNEYQTTMDYIENGSQILGILATNPTVKDLIYKSIPYITKILVSANILPSSLAPLINMAFDGSNNAKPFIDVIDENKSIILEFLESTFGSVASVASNYLDLFKPNISSTSTEYKGLENFFQTLGLSSAIQNIIFKDVIGVDGSTPLPLLDIIYNNLDEIIALISPASEQETDPNTPSIDSSSTTLANGTSLDSSNDTTDSTTNSPTNAMITLIKLLLSKNSETDQYNKFFDVLSGDEKTVFYSSITQLLGNSNSYITNILSLITQSNANFTTENIVNFVSALYNAIQDMFKRNSNYQSFLDANAYQNLTFHAGFVEKPTIDKTSKTITFSYQIYFTLNKKIDFSPVLAAFKNLLSIDTISALLKEFVGTDLDTMVGSIPIVGEFAKEATIKALLQYIPDNLWLGANANDSYYKKNQTTVTYSANQASFWFYPIKVGENYQLGFQFPYNMNIKMDDPSLTNSITSNYNSKTNAVSLLKISNSSWNLNYDIAIDFYFYDFWKTLLSNVILRDYDISEIFTSTAVGADIVATTSTYSPDLYISNLVLTNNVSTFDLTSFVNSYLPTNSANYSKVLSNFMSFSALYTWKDGLASTSLFGAKPVFSSSLTDQVLSQIYSLEDNSKVNQTLNNTNLSLYTSAVPLLNFNLPVKVVQTNYDVNVDIQLRVFMMNVNIYSPVKYYDTTSKTLVNGINHLFLYLNA